MELVDQALMLSTLPYRGARMRGNPRARKLVYGKYLIVYTIDEPRRYSAFCTARESNRLRSKRCALA